MYPLNANDKLKQENTKEERKEVTNGSVRKLVHDRTQRVAHEEPESNIESWDIEPKKIREDQNLLSQDTRDCKQIIGC